MLAIPLGDAQTWRTNCMPTEIPKIESTLQSGQDRGRVQHTARNLGGFWSLIITQFQEAFSDNVLKNVVVFMMLGGTLSAAQEHSIGEALKVWRTQNMRIVSRGICRPEVIANRRAVQHRGNN